MIGIKNIYGGIISYIRKHRVHQSIQLTVMLSFTVVSLLSMVVLGEIGRSQV